MLEQDDCRRFDETSFYFDDDPDEAEHMLGCIRNHAEPYWIGDCDEPDGCAFVSAAELLSAKVFDGRSMQERWEHIVFSAIGGIALEEWLACYGDADTKKENPVP